MDALGRLLGVTWPAWGRSWAVLGPSWALLRHLLDALGCLLAAKCFPRAARDRFWKVPGASGKVFGGPMAVFFNAEIV